MSRSISLAERWPTNHALRQLPTSESIPGRADDCGDCPAIKHFLSAQKEQGRDTGEVPFVRSTMLIDTGASGSAVDHEVLAQLGLQPTGSIAIATPSHDHHDVLTYDIDLIIEQNLFHIADVPVFATGLKKQGIDGLIGRDVLQHMLLVYNGYSGHFTLAV